MQKLTQHQTHQIAAGNKMELTSEMPDFSSMPFEKFYTVIIKSLCDYHQGTVDFSLS